MITSHLYKTALSAALIQSGLTCSAFPQTVAPEPKAQGLVTSSADEPAIDPMLMGLQFTYFSSPIVTPEQFIAACRAIGAEPIFQVSTNSKGRSNDNQFNS